MHVFDQETQAHKLLGADNYISTAHVENVKYHDVVLLFLAAIMADTPHNGLQ